MDKICLKCSAPKTHRLNGWVCTGCHSKAIKSAMKNAGYGHLKITTKCQTCDADIIDYPSEKRMFCNKKCKRQTDRAKQLMREANLGPKCNFWKGGTSAINKVIRNIAPYRDWRTAIFIRDKRTCVWCGSKKDIQADHIKPLFIIIKEYKIKDTVSALNCKELWDLNNGRTLCHKCHSKTETYGPNPYRAK